MARRNCNALILVIVLGYAVTWIWGAPAAEDVVVQRMATQKIPSEAAAALREVVRRESPLTLIGQVHPRITVQFAVPVVPTLILVRAHAVLPGGVGWSETELVFWCGRVIKRLWARA